MMRLLFENLASARIAVIGDMMLDVYLYGEVERISPEAPVPVVRLSSEQSVPGGAANVAANIAHLGGSVRLVGVVGQDDGFAVLSRLLEQRGRIALEDVVIAPDFPTIRKTRLLGHRQQIARIDQERRGSPSAEVQERVAAHALAAIDRCDVVILSDYGKGTLTEPVLAKILAHCLATRKPTIVDPKKVDLAAYRGATVITPNRPELTLATGLPCESDEEARAAAAIASRLAEADVLLTRSEKGMSYFPRVGEPIHLPTVAREVFDVSGAGDTVVAVLGVCLAVGLPMADAMKAANHAAGIVVGKTGTALVSRDELFTDLSLEGAQEVDDGRLVDRAALVRLRAFWKSRGLTVGLTNGCYDLVHPGHVSLIRQAAQNCDRLVVALNTDSSVRRLKGAGRPVQAEAARAEVVGALKGVAAVVLFEEATPYELIAAVQPDLLVKGADYSEDGVIGADIVKAAGGKVLLAQLVPGQSTTRLIAAGGR